MKRSKIARYANTISCLEVLNILDIDQYLLRQGTFFWLMNRDFSAVGSIQRESIDGPTLFDRLVYHFIEAFILMIRTLTTASCYAGNANRA